MVADPEQFLTASGKVSVGMPTTTVLLVYMIVSGECVCRIVDQQLLILSFSRGLPELSRRP